MSLFGRRRMIGSSGPGSVYIGSFRDPATGKIGDPIMVPGSEPGVVIGRNRSGKDTGIGMVNALGGFGALREKSWVAIDPKGEGASISAPYRRTLGPVYILNPFGVLTRERGYQDLASDGWNPVGKLTDPLDPMLFDQAEAIAEALVKLESKDLHWTVSARAMLAGLLIGEVWDAAEHGRQGRLPLLANVRDALGEPSEFDKQTRVPTKGLAARALRIIARGGPGASLMGRFTVVNEEVQGVRATLDGQSQTLLSQPMRDDMAKGSLDLAELGKRPCTLYVIMPPEMVQETSLHSVYLRLVISAALRALYRPSKTVATFYLNEFASLGRLGPIESALGLVAGYGIQLIVVLQSLIQLKAQYDAGWENFLGQAGWVALVGPPADAFTAEYLSKRSGETTFIQPNAGMSFNQGGVGFSSGDAYSRRQFLMPQDLYGLPPGTGWVWIAGLPSPIPVAFPPYFSDPQLGARRARANPYYRG
jgi:type IV secretion system protein VirD4